MKKLLFRTPLSVFLLLARKCSSTVNVTGREVSTIKIGNLEVMTEDLGKMTWDEAKKACKNLGDGWRLPTKDELNVLYENKEKIGGFADHYYWSSTVDDNDIAWLQNFGVGGQSGTIKTNPPYVRAVRASPPIPHIIRMDANFK